MKMAELAMVNSEEASPRAQGQFEAVRHQEVPLRVWTDHR